MDLSRSDLIALTGINYSRAANWITKGVLVPTWPAKGTGHHLRFDETEIRVCRAVIPLAIMADAPILADVALVLRRAFLALQESDLTGADAARGVWTALRNAALAPPGADDAIMLVRAIRGRLDFYVEVQCWNGSKALEIAVELAAEGHAIFIVNLTQALKTEG